MFIDDFLAFAKLAPQAREAGTGGQEPGPFGPITAEEVTFSYPGSERVALHDVCLRIEPGEVVALVGANGSGKTTLAKLLAGLYLPSSGRVCWTAGTRGTWTGARCSAALSARRRCISPSIAAGVACAQP